MTSSAGFFPSFCFHCDSPWSRGPRDLPSFPTRRSSDLVGGDTNGDGNATVPSAGLWSGILFGSGSGGSIYIGSTHVGTPVTRAIGMLLIATNTDSPTISNSMITDNQQWGIQLSGGSAAS